MSPEEIAFRIVTAKKKWTAPSRGDDGGVLVCDEKLSALIVETIRLDEINIEEALDAFWEEIRPTVAGMLFPDAKATALRLLFDFLIERSPAFELGREVPFRVICDDTNNPPSQLALGRLTITVHGRTQGRTWQKDYHA